MTNTEIDRNSILFRYANFFKDEDRLPVTRGGLYLSVLWSTVCYIGLFLIAIKLFSMVEGWIRAFAA